MARDEAYRRAENRIQKAQLLNEKELNLYGVLLTELPETLGQLTQLQSLDLSQNFLTTLPDWIGNLNQLQSLYLSYNKFTDLPPSLAQLEKLQTLDLNANPLNRELAAAYGEGLDSVKTYLSVKAGVQVILNEAKLILVGEGEVGKTCLMDALLDHPWQEHDTTHGIKI
jgi:Leucine-rich repeat (LRR) protein